MKNYVTMIGSLVVGALMLVQTYHLDAVEDRQAVEHRRHRYACAYLGVLNVAVTAVLLRRAVCVTDTERHDMRLAISWGTAGILSTIVAVEEFSISSLRGCGFLTLAGGMIMLGASYVSPQDALSLAIYGMGATGLAGSWLLKEVYKLYRQNQ